MEKTAVAMVDERIKSGKRGCKDVQVFDGGVSALERQGDVARCESGAAMVRVAVSLRARQEVSSLCDARVSMRNANSAS
jgi:hypothetical protein